MTERGARIVVIVFITIGVIVGGAVLSWITTAVTWDGRMPVGEWSIEVRGSDMAALPDACLTVLSREGDVISMPASDSADEARCPFDNYSAQESVCADYQGIIRLRNTLNLGYGGSCWKLFWIWRIGSDPQEGPTTLLLKISAPGYEAATVSVDRLFSEKDITVELEPSD